MRRLLAVLAAALTACSAALPAPAQEPAILVPPAPPAIHHIGVSREAQPALDSLASWSRTQRREGALCLTGYAVIGDTLILGRVGPAKYAVSDSATITGYADSTGTMIPLCGPGVPTIHSHIPLAWGTPERVVYDRPSDVDFNTSIKVGTWALVLAVHDTGAKIIVY